MKLLKLISILFGICVVAMVIPVLLWVLIPIGFICWEPILISVYEIYDYLKK
ncbi:hypothetical protein [Marinisporobacter balticus]|uniref:Uncharacterized protein n=1 Tax=Marinisporobacter balticus TaxID=2018667 RepID=A0A4R2K4G2_9FIRM|nr:hypothetical protein [Marinisporobacter balticus]TCO68053.1 hypothetical protein EV214_1503 [Marinisporobacter balticus]